MSVLNRLPAWRPLGVFLQLAAAVAVLVLVPAAQAEVRLPNGEYTETTEDLNVRVLGGYVSVARSWTNGRWYVNPAWADLKFTFDSLDGSVKAIDRAGSIYERSGNGIYIFDQRFFVQAVAVGYRWYDRLGNWISYDGGGHLTAYGDRNNVRVSFQLDGSGRRTQVLDHFNQPVLTFQYSGEQVTGITDRTGRHVGYQYTGANLTQVTDVLGNLWGYTYDGNGQVTSRTDPEGHTTTIVYAQSTPVVASPSGMKSATLKDATIGVSSSGATPRDYKIARVFTVTDPENHTTTYLYGYDRITQRYTVTQQFPGGRQVIGIYDNEGRLVQQTLGSRVVSTLTRDGDLVELVTDERGLVTRTDYDSARNPLKITYPDGTSVSATYDSVYSNPVTRVDEAGTQTTYQYDGKGNLLTLTEALGLPEQRVTAYTYDGYGQRLTLTRKGTTAAEDATTGYTYDNYGNLATTTDTVGNFATASYDVMGNRLTLTDPRGNPWSRTYNAKGWLLTDTDPLGHTITSTYDKVGNRTRLTDALNNATIFGYNRSDWLVSVTDALNGITQYQYDNEGRRTKVVDANNVNTAFGYDNDGRPTTVTDGNGNVTRTVYGDSSNGLNGLVSSRSYPTYTEQYQYDARNRLTQTIQLLDATTRYTTSAGYDGRGNSVSRTDALNRTTQFAYDAFNRQTQATDPLGGVTQYGYDVRDNLTAMTDANGNATRYAYDKASRRTSETRPLGATTQYAYDGNGNLTTRTNAKGEQRRLGYDTANRRVQEQQFAVAGGVLNSTPSRTLTFDYDARNLLISYADGTTSATYGYDTKGQKTLETVNYGPFSKTIQYGYQANGQKASFTFPDNATVGYTYDGNNQLATVATAQGTLNYAAYQWSAPTQITAPGVVKTMTYDGLLRPTAIKAQAVGSGTLAGPLGPVLLDYRYSYDAVSNIVQRQTQDGAYAYQYDNLDRLTRAEPPALLQASPSNPTGLPLEGYSYDAVHNRMSSQHQPGPWSYNGNNELLSYGQASGQVLMRYDANGHTVLRTENGQPRNLGYDVAEHLTTLRDGAGSPIADYYYDPLGRRLKKTADGVITYFQYGDEGLVAEYDASGSLLRGYGWRPGGLWSTAPQFLRVSGATYFYHNDHLGTPQQLTDSTGGVAWRATADAFGKTNVDVESVANPMRFPGQYYDIETQSHYNNARYYDPTIGRYPSRDRFGLAAGPNPYGYAVANPLFNSDPSGLIACTDWFPTFDTSNCNRIDIGYADNSAQKDELVRSNVLWDSMGPLPGLRERPSAEPKFPEPGRGPGGRIGIKWPIPFDIFASLVEWNDYIDAYYDEWGRFRKTDLVVTETWYCSDGLMCRTSDEIKKRSMTCFGDWTLYDLYMRNFRWNFRDRHKPPKLPFDP